MAMTLSQTLSQEKAKQKQKALSRSQRNEVARCKASVEYFIREYCQIYNATTREWIPFELWAAQVNTLNVFRSNNKVIVLKARQLGLSWLTLCYMLWQMLFFPAATILIFSKTELEAIELLDFRLKGIHDRLPAWMKARVIKSDMKHWRLGNGSNARCFPTTGGRSYTASVVMIDEADFMPSLRTLMNAVQPTVDAGGQMILISTVDKDQPNSSFKRMFRAAEAQETDYAPVFLPWNARPERTEQWYQQRVAESMAQTGTLDDVHQEYPATVEEALAPLTLNKRFPPQWLLDIYQAMPTVATGPAINGLAIYKPVVAGRKYVIGADPAEGNPSSDDSAATILEVDTGEECARLRGKFEPAVFAAYLDSIGKWYNNAPVMVERNNHGHAVLLALQQTKVLRRLVGRDGRPGWLSTTVGKVTLYDALAESIRENATSKTKILHSRDTFEQLLSIEGATLRAPEGDHDDLADSFALAEVGRIAYNAVPSTSPQSVSMQTM